MAILQRCFFSGKANEVIDILRDLGTGKLERAEKQEKDSERRKPGASGFSE